MFKEFTDEAYRISANLGQVYEGLREIKAASLALPDYMTWKTINGTRYLYRAVDGVESSMGRESPQTAALYDAFKASQSDIQSTLEATQTRFAQLAAQYRALRLPQVMSMSAKILESLDLNGQLGISFLVVGSAAFPAYELEAGGFFLQGLDETEDFDLSWMPAGDLTLSGSAGKNFHQAILTTDKTFAVSVLAGHKMRNKNAFEIDILCPTGSYFHSAVPNRHAILGSVISPLELDGQDVLHHGNLLRHVCIGRSGTPAPLVVPDPRCMAIHKLWLSQQPDRISLKRRKDERQAMALWDMCLHQMPRFSVTREFMESLPDRWREVAGRFAS